MMPVDAIPFGRVEKTTAQAIDGMSGASRSRFVFRDLEGLDPDGRYKVIVHDGLFKGWSGGLPILVQNEKRSFFLNFHLRSFQQRFGVQPLNAGMLLEAVLSTKANLLKKREEDPEFALLVGLLYEGPYRYLSAASDRALEKLIEYSKSTKKAVRLSAKRFGLSKSVTIQEDFVVKDVKGLFSKSGEVKLKWAQRHREWGAQIVRRIAKPDLQFADTLTRFRDKHHVISTLATVSYVNSKGKDVFVSYHPAYQTNLSEVLARKELPMSVYCSQIEIADQILIAMRSISQEGIHGDLHLGNILLSRLVIHIAISGLEAFKPHEASEEWGPPIQADWSAPEVRTVEHPPKAAAVQDVWSLGLIFYTLFQREDRQKCYFLRCTQEKIDEKIESMRFPAPIAVMIQGMLQIDPAKRWSLKQVHDYFDGEVKLSFGRLIASLRKDPINDLLLEKLRTYAEKYGQNVHFFSSNYFEIERSAVVALNRIEICDHTIQLTLLDNQTKVVTCKTEGSKMATLLDLFASEPHVLPILRRDSLGSVSHHPFLAMNLRRFLIQDEQFLDYETQLDIGHQILLGVEKIHEKGSHGSLCLENIRIDGNFRVVISGLEKFETHDREVVPGGFTMQDVWFLGCIFYTLFQKSLRKEWYFLGSSQERIDAVIGSIDFPPPIASMIQGILQSNPAKRWSLKQVRDYFDREVKQDFGRVIDSLRKSPIDGSSIKSLQTYAERCKKTIRFSAKYFRLGCGVTVTSDLVALDVKKKCIAKNRGIIKLALLANDDKIVIRRSCPYQSKIEEIFKLFLDTPHVLSTLGMARYINKKGLDILISYHPLFDMDLRKFLIKDDQFLDYKTQVDICHKILLGVEKIHEKGSHGDLYLQNILIDKDFHVVVSDLETFKPHDASGRWGWPLQCDWSAPEVRTALTATAAQDIWSLGLIFYALFQRSQREERYFRTATQEQIDAAIGAKNFPPPVAAMIQGMLQVDPAKRLTLKEVRQHAQQSRSFLETQEVSKRNECSPIARKESF